MKKQFIKGILSLHVSIIFVSFAAIFSKAVAQPVTIIIAGRVLTGFLALSLVRCFFFQSGVPVSRRDAFMLFFLGLVLACHWLSFFAAVKMSSVAVGVLSFSTYPALILLLEVWRQRRCPAWTEIMMVCGAVIGTALLNPPDSSGLLSVGVLYGLLSGVLYAFLLLANRYMADRYGGLLVGWHEQRSALIFLSPFLFWHGPGLSAVEIGLITVLGVFCTAFAHTLFIQGSCWVQPRTASLINSLEPVYSILYAMLIFREFPEYTALTGGVLILLSSTAAQLQELRLSPK
jgi:drug/metabolite transporter (DMT)-like permease